MHSDEVPFTGQVPFEVREGLLLVVLEGMPLFVAQRAFHEVDGVLDVVWTQRGRIGAASGHARPLPRPVVWALQLYIHIYMYSQLHAAPYGAAALRI